eukprot:TRINITY_DN2552_c0_g2_i1.p1 TRINITY_DN2552_c0_g2~~TRINITY_DN2552_c0_g2_i1.p1  ORF type:complete len:412 (+),score=36.83 TRINITY_DN2552_c0_g2_i1:48-1238(+)
MFGGSKNYNPNGDQEICVHPQDGVSSLTFSPVADLIVASCWDDQVLCWEINKQNGQSQAKASQKFQSPVLCTAWTPDGANVFCGGCDNQVSLWNLQTNQMQVVAKHDKPVRHCFYLQDKNMLVTGSWDKTVRYWDVRQPNQVYVHQCRERVYAMDVLGALMVIGTADRGLQVINTGNPQTVFLNLDSPLKWQTRCLTCFPDQQGYLVGSIEGRVAVQNLNENTTDRKNFSFKCHRDNNDAYAVNAMNFHPVHGTFVTAGSDGSFCFWDKESRQRLRNMQRANQSISAATFNNDAYAVNAMNFHPVHGTFVTAGSDGSFCFWDKESRQRLRNMQRANQSISAATFNNDGSLYVYAVSYDWSKGYKFYDRSKDKNYVLIHKCTDQDVKRKPKTTSNRR